ncbi:MAG: hypothetical protein ABII12_11805 [Planctomycetota bacterium]
MHRKAASPGLPDPGAFPRSLGLDQSAEKRVLAMGGELKSSLCLLSGATARMSEPLGSLSDPEEYRRYDRLVEKVMTDDACRPEVVAHDLHPQYVSTLRAQRLELPTIAVQHHHAHIVSVIADMGHDGPVVGICCDGVGYGTDGAAWGCEIMACDASGFERLSHLRYFPLIGGDAAAIHTWRPAVALLEQAYGPQWRENLPPAFARVPPADLDVVEAALSRKVNAPLSSSLGRVFDAVSFMLGLCDKNEHEAQAAIALEAAASGHSVEPYAYETITSDGSLTISVAPMVRALVRDLRAERSICTMSARFHETVARMLAAGAVMGCEVSGVSTVALSGGCFANRRLLGRLTERLTDRGLTVLVSRRVSFGDDGLSLGQAFAAAAMYERTDACA